MGRLSLIVTFRSDGTYMIKNVTVRFFGYFFHLQKKSPIFLVFCLFFVQRLANLKDSEYINRIRGKINNTAALPAKEYGPAPGKMNPGTAHISIVAGDGDAVSLTSTINS
jgi:hypothetical protein